MHYGNSNLVIEKFCLAMVLQVFSFGFPSNMYLVVRMTEAGVKGGKNFLYGKASEPCSVKYCLTNWILSVFPHLWFKKCIEASKIKASIMSIDHFEKELAKNTEGVGMVDIEYNYECNFPHFASVCQCC